MNEEQRIQYSQKHLRRVKAFERRFIPGVFRAIKGQLMDAVAILKSSGPDALKLAINNVLLTHNLAPQLRDIWQDVAYYFARKTVRDINASARTETFITPEQKAGFGTDPEWTATIIEYLRQHLLIKTKDISDTTRLHILAILEKGRTEGWSVDKMAFELEHSNLTLARARLIVRTETVMAENMGKKMGRESSPFESTKTWIAAHDARTRHSHRDIDGTIVDEDRKFRVDRYKGEKLVGYDLMTGPGDPTAHAENICNCRCTTAVRVKRDADGRPIRKIAKRNIFVALPGEFTKLRETVTI